MTDQHLPLLSSSKSRTQKLPQKGKLDDYALCQEYAAYIAQLRGLLEETTQQPPAGVHTAEVERRIALIQSALNEVERRSEETQCRIEARNNERLLRTYERRIKAEEEAEQKRQEAEKQRVGQVEELRTMQIAYYKDRNDRTEAKAQQCRAHTEQVQEETVMRASSNEERRSRNLANLEAERLRQQKEMQIRDQARQDYARRVRDRQAAQDALQNDEKAKLAEIHQQEMEAKLSAMRDSKRSKWVAKRNACRSRSVLVWKNGEAVLETERKEHGDLIKELEQRMRQQASRYAEEKADRDAYIRQRQMVRAAREERQENNLRRLIEQRVSRGAEIVKAAAEKKERAQQAKERQAVQYTEAARQLDEEVWQHQQRAQKLQEIRTDAALSQNYKRWNHRAARIMQELQEALSLEDELRSERSNTGLGGRRQTSHGYGDSERSWGANGDTPASRRGYAAVRLPSPTEFAV